jgi:hypothetical protein
VKPRSSILRYAELLAAVALFAVALQAQTGSAERNFPQSKATTENMLKLLQANMAGRLPVLEGFAKAAEHPLEHYQRGYYQATVDVRPTASGGSLVRVSAKVTAWYADPNGAKSGYQLLISNGRIEADLLDQLEDQLAKGSPDTSSGATSTSSAVKRPDESRPASTVLAASGVAADRTFSPSTRLSLPERTPSYETSEAVASQKKTSSLQAEADTLQQILNNMAHPKNLVAVRKSGTPVVSTPSLTAKADFLASMHDEFELLDFTADWVHVRISGLSRGWIWRNSVEMPEGIGDVDVSPANALAQGARPYHVVREESAPFPGDWPALRSKSVKILSVQRLVPSGKETEPKERLEYAKFLLRENYNEIAQKQQGLEGIVIIFDSADGGMIAATTATLQQWVAGALSDTSLWKNCFFDPPQTFDSAGSSASK